MWNNGNNYNGLWIILIIILLFSYGWGGNSCGCNSCNCNGCGCNTCGCNCGCNTCG